MKNDRSSPIRVALYGMDSRSYKTMAMYLKGPCKGIAVVVESEADADIDIIDADATGSRDILDGRRQKNPDRPIILLSLQTLQIENTIFVKKPVNAQQLVEALLKAKPKPAVNTPVPPKSQPENIAKTAVAPSNQGTEQKPQSSGSASQTSAATRRHEVPTSAFLGTVAEIDFTDPAQWPAASFEPRKFFLGYVQSAYKIAKKENRALQLNSIWKPLLIYPETDQIWLDADDKQLRVFAGIEQNKAFASSIALKPINGSDKEFKSLENFQNMDAFLWKLTVWTSKGRFPVGMDLTKPIFLKRWPNFTRLMMTPDALRIAALLTAGTRTPLELIRVLRINPQYVFAFISACQSAGLIGMGELRVDEARAPDPPKPAQKHGLLNKILSKLRGK